MEKESTVLQTDIFALTSKMDATKEIIRAWKEQPEWQAIHTFLPMKAQLQDSTGFNLLHVAITTHNFSLIEKIINTSGVDVNAAYGHTQKTALILAIEEDLPGTVQTLLKAGANPNQTRESGATALHSAVMLGNHTIIRLLLKYGADINRANNSGATPLSVAKVMNDPTIIDLLKSKTDKHRFFKRKASNDLSLPLAKKHKI